MADKKDGKDEIAALKTKLGDSEKKIVEFEKENQKLKLSI